MKKLRFLFITAFFLLAFLLIGSGCRLGPADSNCHGLCKNDMINCQECGVQCVRSTTCGCLSPLDYKEIHITENNLGEYSSEILENSEGNGQNGYLTVRFFADLNKIRRWHYLSYKVNIFDNGELVGSAIAVLNEEELKQQIQNTAGTITITDIINVKIDRYIMGAYSCSIEYIKGSYTN